MPACRNDDTTKHRAPGCTRSVALPLRSVLPGEGPGGVLAGSSGRQAKSMLEKLASFDSRWVALTRRTVPDFDRMTSDCVVALLAE